MLTLVSSGFLPNVLPQTLKLFTALLFHILYCMLMNMCLLILMMPSNLWLWSERIFFSSSKLSPFLHHLSKCWWIYSFQNYFVTLQLYCMQISNSWSLTLWKLFLARQGLHKCTLLCVRNRFWVDFINQSSSSPHLQTHFLNMTLLSTWLFTYILMINKCLCLAFHY